ncbi:hypothetical protein TIFTF001_013803 [Ficus carica]|uniref:DNA-directed RNA polymerase III subunit RPC3 n=1 Tax=Ficus carica TaxID=3494 RepID=A0AA87ZYE5_FICCA|nr:hypothetical protein TIFTF001_013803 [Ficus carica]
MATPYGIELAVHLITSHFGNLVAKVCENLLRRGPVTLQLLIRSTELTPLQVKNSLLILIQHNCCEELLEGLLQHGRLTLEQIYERAKSRDPAVQDAVQESFHKLLNSRFVERCPVPEPFVEPPAVKSSNKRGAKSAKLNEASETEEQRILAAAAPHEALRFSILTTSGTKIDKDKKDADGSSEMGVGEKRKYGALDSDEEFGSKEKEVILWRANFEEFIRCLRHKACIENVRARMDDGTAIVVRALLDATRSAEKKVRTENSEVIKSEAGRSLTLDRVRASLVQLGCSSSGIDDTYSIDLKRIIELAQDEEVESIVLKRYGRDAYRMFRLLSKDGQFLETEKIADIAFVDKKETPRILHKLWKDEYVQMEKLIMGTRQAFFMLWKVNKHILCQNVLDELYHAALNLSLRVIHEQEQKKELFIIPPEKRTGPLEKEFKRLRNIKIYLESSVMKLDDALMLFHDF